jgi:hypothetical protein
MRFLILKHTKRRLEPVGDEHDTLESSERQAHALAEKAGADVRFSIVATNGWDIAALVTGSRSMPDWARFQVDLSRLAKPH